jgi:hypothetical protein
LEILKKKKKIKKINK